MNNIENSKVSHIVSERKFNAKAFIFQWESLLAVILLAIVVFNYFASDGIFSGWQIVASTANFLDRAFIVLAMALVLITGKIDISVGSATALCSVLMAMAFNAGLPMPAAMVLCLIIGLTCGIINGVIVVEFPELPAMIVTLSTMIIYRGIALVLLEDQASGGLPQWFQFLSWGDVGRIPFMLLVFVVMAVIFWLLLHKTSFGRQLYAMGKNEVASNFSGIKVKRNTLIVFALNGLMAGTCALFLTSRMGSTRPNVAIGYELDVIAMVVLGGVPAIGGKGSIPGVVMAVFIIGFLRFGLGLFNVPGQVLIIIIGCLLIGSVLISNFAISRSRKISDSKSKK